MGIGIYRSTTMYKTSGVIKFQYGIKTKSRLISSFVSNCDHCDVRYNFCIKTMVGSSFLPVVCRRYHDLFTLFCFLRIALSNTYLRCVYVLFLFLCLVNPMLAVSLDCPFLIAPSVFSNVYL